MSTTKTLSVHDAIKYMTLHDPDLTNSQISDRLNWLGLPECSVFLVGQIRGQFRRDLYFLKKVGLLRERKPTIPSRIKNVRAPKPEPARGSHYGRQSKDD